MARTLIVYLLDSRVYKIKSYIQKISEVEKILRDNKIKIIEDNTDIKRNKYKLIYQLTIYDSNESEIWVTMNEVLVKIKELSFIDHAELI